MLPTVDQLSGLPHTLQQRVHLKCNTKLMIFCLCLDPMRTTHIRVSQLAHISICASGSSTVGTVQSNIMKMAVMIQIHNSIQTDELSVRCCHLLVKGSDLLTGGILMLQSAAVIPIRCCIRINTLF